jgi:hypothetical protein
MLTEGLSQLERHVGEVEERKRRAIQVSRQIPWRHPERGPILYECSFKLAVSEKIHQ